MTSPPITVLELFQSQGCSSCPPANSNILSLISQNKPEYLILTYDVTYWDYLGWKDTFGDKKWDDRQKEYARGLGTGRMYTPQVIVNGRVDGVGSRKGELDKLIQAGTQIPFSVDISVRRDEDSSRRVVTVTANTDAPDSDGSTSIEALVLVVRYDPGLHQVDIPRGENSGRTLPHQNVVRNVTQIGTWQPRAPETTQTFEFDVNGGGDGPDAERFEAAVLVQSGPGGPIIGAARVPR
jgi:hypothetical protein